MHCSTVHCSFNCTNSCATFSFFLCFVLVAYNPQVWPENIAANQQEATPYIDFSVYYEGSWHARGEIKIKINSMSSSANVSNVIHTQTVRSYIWRIMTEYALFSRDINCSNFLYCVKIKRIHLYTFIIM